MKKFAPFLIAAVCVAGVFGWSSIDRTEPPKPLGRSEVGSALAERDQVLMALGAAIKDLDDRMKAIEEKK